MKKVIVSLAVVAVASLTATAQKESSSDKPLKFSVGVEAGLPVGDLKDASSFGIGGSVQGEYAAAETVGITLNAGFLAFSGKTIELLGSKIKNTNTFIPVLVGAKFYFAEKVYGHAQAGLTFWKAKVTETFEGQTTSESGNTSAFTFAPGIGFNVAENFDVELKYQSFSKSGATLSFLGLRAAFTF